jgi:hypothetical protein
MQIICVKIGSLSEFETYLLAERLGLDYLAFNEIRADKTVKKYWLNADNGIVLAVEREIYGEREFDLIVPLNENQIAAIKKCKPVLAGEPTRKYKGDIDEAREAFNELVEEEKKYREKMLNRKYDPSNIVCINAKSTLDQVFATCVANDVDPVPTISFIYGNGHLEMTRVWFEKKTGVLVAYSYQEDHKEYYHNVDCLIPKKAISNMSHSPQKTPKLKVNEDSIGAYQRLKSIGIDLGIEKLEKVSLVQKKRELLEKLQQDLIDAIDTEDYEKAAVLRDRIKAMEENK